ncbi:ATP-binding cassette domain-containing protein [Iocasia frigidifontis]|uniref:ATP-binding cassette domain-containing protein n=1 Tax=Iocasia fonsfrigidae TaxID=2682810 RepID=A0A8A7K5T3_9FIRM|nr:ATP-binding cassette domain-containing protein [Iocasia fonsfrigidae]QTL97133.1 ATP-binding cassette domain-containing protein [Iocasia fonsfrigidae]
MQQENRFKLTIIGGYNKNDEPEDLTLTISAGEVVSIVGPTGSGKSQLLADIEWMAQGDTPTGRRILINDQIPDSEMRYDIESKLVAQLSQNMNFVMDVTVQEFVQIHASSRKIKNSGKLSTNIIEKANQLAGEKFTADTPLTSLSGGQSRALMIADTAYLSKSPIVLIDEIENAGIDRKIALDLLVKREKIILLATHDPILALLGNRRLVIKNGGIYKIIEATVAERKNLEILEKLDRKLMLMRNRLRHGEKINYCG